MRIEIARGWDLFHLGAFDEAEASFLDQTHDDEAVRLLLWIAIRRGDVAKKLRYGEMLAQSEDVNLAAIGRAHENVALASSNQAPKSWLPAHSRFASAEVAYARALVRFVHGSADGIRVELSSVLPHTAEQRVRYAQLRAWAKALGEDFEGQAHLLAHALTIAIKEHVDRWLTSIVAGSLAVLARDIELRDIAEHVDEQLDRVAWPVDSSIYTFYGLRGMASRKAMRGEWIRAMHLLDEAAHRAPDVLRRGLVCIDRGRISQVLSEQVALRSNVDFAFTCFFDVDWNSGAGDDAVGVMTAMDLLRADQIRARELMNVVEKTQPSKISGSGHGRRFEAFRQFALSQLTRGEEGLAHAQVGYRIFKEIKYLHRAADCAMRAVELGGGARWRQRVERLIETYPRSLIAHRYRQVMSPIARIRGRRKEVMEALATTGATFRDIGMQLGMAEETVRKHFQHLRKLLGVDDRSQLVRLYLEAGNATPFAGERAFEQPMPLTPARRT